MNLARLLMLLKTGVRANCVISLKEITFSLVIGSVE